MIEVVIPSMRPAERVLALIAQIQMTAGCSYRIVLTGTDGSAAANRNLGLSRVSGDVVAMVDDDVQFGPESAGWLRIMLEALQRPEVVMVSAQLLTPRGEFAYMTGLQDCGLKPRRDGESVVPSKRLLTACCAFKVNGLSFDEGYVGSGFEDVDFCNQLAQARPDGKFLICHAALAVHKNEAKNQGGENWKRNEARYLSKWGPEMRGKT